jgi:hypothetical protein
LPTCNRRHLAPTQMPSVEPQPVISKVGLGRTIAEPISDKVH